MEEGSCDQHGQNEELQNQPILPQIDQEDGRSTDINYKREEDFQTRNKSVFAGFSKGSSCQESYETNKNTKKMQHESRTNVINVSSDIEYDDDSKDVVVKTLQKGCDKISFNQKQDIFILPYQLKKLSLNQISSAEILKVNVPENSSTNRKDSINLTTSAIDPKKMKFRNDIIEQSFDENITIGETAINPYVRGKLRASNPQIKGQFSFLKSQSLEIVQDSSGSIFHGRDDHDHQLHSQMPEIVENYTHKNIIGGKVHHQNGPQQSNLKDERKTKEGSAITRPLSLSSQKSGLSLKTESLESRPIYPNIPYSPYASPCSSPRSNRQRTPLRESRRVSIEQSGSFLQLNQYKLLDQIGQGSYGLVKLAYSEEDSTHYAMKILSKHRLVRRAGLIKRGQKQCTSPLDRVYREIAVLKKLDHPNVVKLIEVLDDPVEDSLYMVFELVKQGEVLSIPTNNPLSEERAWNVFRDTLKGLEYLHYQRIIHADIKPGNLLLTECGRVKIADLGVCNEFNGEDAIMTNGSTAGTPAFRAPETLNVGQNIYCGKAADIWALGATLYALVYGNVPFIASSIPALYEKIKTEKLCFPDIPKTSVKLKDCILGLLKKDPGLRIKLPQLKEHVWVNSDGLTPLPSEEENCRLVQVNDDDINSVVRSIPKLDTLILIKTMLKKHSFGNPFSRGVSGEAPQCGGSRLERFIRAGRSNSAPGTYDIVVNRQLSGDNLLPALCEHSPLS